MSDAPPPPPFGLNRLPGWALFLVIAGSLYLFLVGIGAMGAGFKLEGKGFAEQLLATEGHPFVSLFIGIFATTLVQSSSTTTSIIVGLVAAEALPVDAALFMVMGANIGTTVTNTVVSLGHITRSNEFKRAFAAATVHDFFNIIVLLVIFPLELYTKFLSGLSKDMTEIFTGVGGLEVASPIKIITKPAINVVQSIAMDNGIATVVLGILMTFAMLFCLVKALRCLLVSKLENLFDKTLFKTPYRGLTLGIFMTILVQSSSITTSVVVPLVGAGILTIRQIFPVTLGANIGTTITPVLASLAAVANADDPSKAIFAITVAFDHVLFNVFGVMLIWPFRRLPIVIATKFAELAMWNRLIPLFYIVIVFYVLPLLIIMLGS
ncbi:MAG: Na/Pi symporter [Planctomycetota bacterium]|jgi:sodium-dependent phosphate cotransporter